MLFRNAVLFGVVAAVVGCGSKKDEVTYDVYNAPAPVVVPVNDQGAKLTISDVSNKADAKIDLEDSLDVSEASPAKVDILSDCKVNAAPFSQKFSFTNPRQIRIASIIPEKLFATDFNASQAHCTYTVSLQNERGSRKVFTIGMASISDVNESQVKIQVNGSEFSRSDSKLTITSQKDSNVIVRYNNTETASAKIVCHDFQILDVPFNHVISFTDFDFVNKAMNSPLKEEDLKTIPTELCRILVSQNGGTVATSPLFTIAAAANPPEKLKIELLNRAPQEPGFANVGGALLDGRGQITFSKVRITNPDPSLVRVVRIPRNSVLTIAEVFMSRKSGPIQKLVLNPDWITFDVQVEGVSILHPEDTNYFVDLLPGESFVVTSLFTTHGPLNCGGDPSIVLNGLRLTVPAEIDIAELDAGRNPIEAHKMNLGTPLLFNFAQKEDYLFQQADQVGTDVFACHW